MQFLAGPQDIREGGLGWLLRGIAWISLVVGPVLLLLLIQAQFLPYHLAWVTWVQRFTVLADVVLLWALWPAVLAGRSAIEWPRFSRCRFAALASIFTIWLSLTAATFPGESIDSLTANQNIIPPASVLWPVVIWKGDEVSHRVEPSKFEEIDPEGNEQATDKWTSVRDLLFNGDVDTVTRRRKSLFSNTLVLPGFDLLNSVKIDEKKLELNCAYFLAARAPSRRRCFRWRGSS